MHKSNKNKLKVIRQITDPSQCDYCDRTDNQTYLSKFIQKSLISKYGKSGIDTTQSSNFNNFVDGRSKTFQGGYKQFMCLYNPFPIIFKYYKLNETSSQITEIIQMNTVKNSGPHPIHLVGIHLVSMHRYIKLKAFCQDCKSLQIFHSTSSTKQLNRQIRQSQKNSQKNRRYKDNKLKTQNKSHVLDINSSFEQIAALAKNIDIMCANLKHKKKSINYDKQIKARKNSRQHKVSQKTVLFSKQLEKKLSKIQGASSQQKKKKNIKKIQTQTEQIYGLENYSHKQASKQVKKIGYYSNYRCETEKPIENIYDSPVSRAYYPRRYLQTQQGQLCNIQSHVSKKAKRSSSIKSKSLTKKFSLKHINKSKNKILSTSRKSKGEISSPNSKFYSSKTNKILQSKKK